MSLSQFDDDFRNAEPSRLGGSTVPEGTYHVLVERASIRQARSTGNDQLALSLRICEGDYAGRMLWFNKTIVPNTMSWLKRDLLNLNVVIVGDPNMKLPKGVKARVKLQAFSDLETQTVLDAIAGASVIVEVTHKELNNGKIQADPQIVNRADDTEHAPPPHKNDDIPF